MPLGRMREIERAWTRPSLRGVLPGPRCRGLVLRSAAATLDDLDENDGSDRDHDDRDGDAQETAPPAPHDDGRLGGLFGDLGGAGRQLGDPSRPFCEVLEPCGGYLEALFDNGW